MRKVVTASLGAGLVVALAVASGPNSAWAQDCPGNPDALGTSRVLAIDPAEYPRIGAMDHGPKAECWGRAVVSAAPDCLFCSRCRASASV